MIRKTVQKTVANSDAYELFRSNTHSGQDPVHNLEIRSVIVASDSSVFFLVIIEISDHFLFYPFQLSSARLIFRVFLTV